MAWKARIFWVFLASIALMVVLAVTAIFYDGMPFQEQVILTVFLFAMHSLAALLGAVMWQRKSARLMVRLGVGLVLLGGLGWIALIWLDEFDVIDYHGQDLVARISATGTIPGLAFMLRALVLWPSNRNKAVHSLSIGAWGCGCFGGLLILGAIWIEDWWWIDEYMVKLIASAFTISAGCAVSVFVVARLTKGDLIDLEDADLGIRAPVRLDCPRCGRAVSLEANRHARCEGCKLKLMVEFEEPRCKCGYLLYGLESAVCPECGSAIAEELRWS